MDQEEDSSYDPIDTDLRAHVYGLVSAVSWTSHKQSRNDLSLSSQ